MFRQSGGKRVTHGALASVTKETLCHRIGDVPYRCIVLVGQNDDNNVLIRIASLEGRESRIPTRLEIMAMAGLSRPHRIERFITRVGIRDSRPSRLAILISTLLSSFCPTRTMHQ